MNIEFWTIVIQAVVTIVTGGFVVKTLRQQITSQQQQIDTMKSSIDSMKSFVEIFDLQKLKEYVSLSEESNKMKADLEVAKHMREHVYPELQRFNQEILSLNDKHHKEIMNHLEANLETTKKHNELLDFLALFAALIPEGHNREETLYKLFPKNAQGMMKIVNSYSNEEILSFREKIQTLLDQRNRKE